MLRDTKLHELLQVIKLHNFFVPKFFIGTKSVESIDFIMNFIQIVFLQLYDRISSTVVSPQRAPPGDSVSRCRDVVDVLISASELKYNRERNELLQLLSLPHVQVSLIVLLNNNLHVINV